MTSRLLTLTDRRFIINGDYNFSSFVKVRSSPGYRLAISTEREPVTPMIDKAAHQILPSTPSEITSSENSSIKVDRPKPLPALLFSLLPLLLVGLVIFGFLTGPLRFVQSEQTGPTSESREIGQRIRAEHAALKAITVRLPAQQVVSQELKLHLRRFSDSQDLRVSGNGQPGKEAGWVRFEFAPLEAQYRGQSLFFLLEQGGTPFQLIGDEQNVYLGGESFIDGQATGGDLAFELEYAPDPAGLLGIYFERQTAYGGLPWIGMVALALWIGLAIGGCLALALRPARFIPGKLRQMTGRQFRPVALYFLLMGFFGMLAFIFITPPLQGLDEQGHVGRTVFVYEYNSAPARYPQLYAETYQLEKQGRYSEYIPGFSYDNPEIDFANLSPLSETYQPPVYYAVAGGVLRLGSWLTENHSLLFQMYMVRLASLLFGLGTLGVGLVWAYYLRREAPWLVLVVPGAVAMLPTYLSISGVANNDNAVNFFTSLVIFGLTVLYKEGRTQNYNRVFWRKWWPVLVIVAGSAVLSYQSKHTSGAFLGGLAFGVFVYFCFLTSKLGTAGIVTWSGSIAGFNRCLPDYPSSLATCRPHQFFGGNGRQEPDAGDGAGIHPHF